MGWKVTVQVCIMTGLSTGIIISTHNTARFSKSLIMVCKALVLHSRQVTVSEINSCQTQKGNWKDKDIISKIYLGLNL